MLHNITNQYGCIVTQIHFWDSLALLAVHFIIGYLRTQRNMSEKPPSKDEALEALDFIVNVLKEHEKDLDRLVSELGTVAGQLGETGELSGKVKKIEDKINGLQNDVGNLVKSLSTSPHEPASLAAAVATKDPKSESAPTNLPNGLPLLLQCKQWEDFQALAAQAQTLSFAFKELEKTFESNALKNNQIISYSGEIPKLSSLLKTYLSKHLEIPEKQILEGDMALG